MAQSTVELLSEVVVDLTEEVPIRVLHVDDEVGFLKAAKQLLEMQGPFQVETASSVEEAMEKMKEKTFDVVVSDYVMPGKDGLEFLKELRDSGNDIPFIIFTGKGREEVAIKALNFGADQYFNKVGDPETVYGELTHGIRQAVEIKRASMEIRRREERLRAVLTSSPDAITVIDLSGNVVECNQATLDLYAWSSKDEIIGKSGFEFVARKDQQRAIEDLKKSMEQVSVRNLEYTCLTKDGREFIAGVFASVIKDSSGNPIGFVTIAKDITKHKQIEEKLRSIFASSPNPITVIDLNGNITECNQATLDMLGYSSEEELIGKNGFVLIAEKDRERAKENLIKLFEQGSVKNREYTALTKDGREIAAELSASVIKDSSKNPIGFVAITRDITKRKRVEEALRESEEKFRNIFESANDCMIYLDGSGRILDVNGKAVEVFGGSKKELLGKHFAKAGIFSPREMPKVMSKFADALTGKQPTINLIIKNKEGQEIPLECSASLMEIDDKFAGVLVIARDVRERKKAEEALRESEDKFRKIFEGANDEILFLDKYGKIVDVNKRIEDIFGYKRDEVIGKNFAELGFPQPKDLQMLLKLFEDAIRKGGVVPLMELELKDKKGNKVPVEASTSLIKKGGKIEGLLIIVRDITERKKAEKAILEAQEKLMITNEKLGVVGKLTRHDARNRLSTVTMNVFLTKKKLTGDHEALEYLSEIESAVKQTERIFDFARTYEKLGVEELAYMDVEKSLEEAVMLFSDLQNIKVVNDCHGLTVLADSLLRQLLYNLIDNSLKHGEKVSQIRAYYEKAGKDQLKLVYEDDGVGIPKAEKEKIFKEGYGKGTGYGLYLIRKICEVYGWNIRETGKRGKGAHFTITIPKTKENGKERYLLH